MRRWLPISLLLLVACDEGDGTQPNREYAPDMVSSRAYDSFAPNPNTRDGRTLMKPPRGTIPRGFQVFRFGPGPDEAKRAGAELRNPLPATDAVRARGNVAFERYCSHCHGHGGLGDGLVAMRFPRPPSLVAPHAKGMADGQIFHVITHGQGLMPGHAQQVSSTDRWTIVHHVRRLQTGEPLAAPGGSP